MTIKSLRLMTIAGALILSACIAVDASAQCCGQPVTSYYAPAYTSYYAPATYQTYYSGWYPGYWLDRFNAAVWGTPTTYAAAYPATTYYAGYRPAYYVGYSGYTTSYAPACSTCASYAPVSTCSTCTASYAPAPCSTCSSYTTSYAPACSTCSPCSTCSTCQSGCSTCSSCSAAPVVTQASYQESAATGCSNCLANAAAAPATYSQPPAYTQPQAATREPTPAATPMPQPSLPSTNAASPTVTNRPADAPPQLDVQPRPINNQQPDPYEVKKSESSTYFEAPKLFNPNDRTAHRSISAPVRTAVYEQQATYRQSSAVARGPITAEQANRDAIGWSSASN